MASNNAGVASSGASAQQSANGGTSTTTAPSGGGSHHLHHPRGVQRSISATSAKPRRGSAGADLSATAAANAKLQHESSGLGQKNNDEVRNQKRVYPTIIISGITHCCVKMTFHFPIRQKNRNSSILFFKVFRQELRGPASFFAWPWLFFISSFVTIVLSFETWSLLFLLTNVVWSVSCMQAF